LTTATTAAEAGAAQIRGTATVYQGNNRSAREARKLTVSVAVKACSVERRRRPESRRGSPESEPRGAASIRVCSASLLPLEAPGDAVGCGDRLDTVRGPQVAGSCDSDGRTATGVLGSARNRGRREGERLSEEGRSEERSRGVARRSPYPLHLLYRRWSAAVSIGGRSERVRPWRR
jgi:hypothetical protein